VVAKTRPALTGPARVRANRLRLTVRQCHAIARSRPRVSALPPVRMLLPAPHRVPAPVEPEIRHEESTMTIPSEVEALVLRLHHVEKWGHHCTSAATRTMAR
jgi:hypothetical protein